MKVFKMNDYDFVCANNEQQAKEYYKEEVKIDDEEIEIDFEGEVSLNKTMLISFDDLPEEEKHLTEVDMKLVNVEIFVYRSFEWIIKYKNITKPCIIASTEF